MCSQAYNHAFPKHSQGDTARCLRCVYTLYIYSLRVSHYQHGTIHVNWYVPHQHTQEATYQCKASVCYIVIIVMPHEPVDQATPYGDVDHHMTSHDSRSLDINKLRASKSLKGGGVLAMTECWPCPANKLKSHEVKLLLAQKQMQPGNKKALETQQALLFNTSLGGKKCMHQRQLKMVHNKVRTASCRPASASCNGSAPSSLLDSGVAGSTQADLLAGRTMQAVLQNVLQRYQDSCRNPAGFLHVQNPRRCRKPSSRTIGNLDVTMDANMKLVCFPWTTP